MMPHLSRSTKLMSFGIVLSLGWFLFESCDCDTKQQEFPFNWVACVGNKPTLMYYLGDSPVQYYSADTDLSGYKCSHNGSPQYKGSEAAPYAVGGPAGPSGYERQGHATAAPLTAWIPQQLRDLPFLPDIPPSAAAPTCQSSFPDVLQTNHDSGGLTRITTCPFAIKTVIPLGTNTLQVAVTPDGSTAIVTSFDNAVYFVDLATNTVSYTLLTDSTINPNGIAISPDGKRAYVTSFTSFNPVVIVLDLTSPTKSIIATIPTIQYPSGATLTPDGSQLWITSPLAFDMAVIDTLTNTNATNLAIGTTTDVAFNSTGTRAYVTSGAGASAGTPGQVYVVNTGTYQTVQTYTVGASPADISMSYGNQWLVVNNNADNSISVIDLLKQAVKTTQVGGTPSGIAWMQ